MRSAEIRRLRLCYRCLYPGHQYKDCTTRLYCNTCGKGHASVHHDPNFKSRREQNYTSPQSAQQPANTNNGTMTAATDARSEQPEIKRTVLATAAVINGSTTMAIPVKLSTISGRTVLVYAILDNMSDSCYVCPEILRKLGA